MVHHDRGRLAEASRRVQERGEFTTHGGVEVAVPSAWVVGSTARLDVGDDKRGLVGMRLGQDPTIWIDDPAAAERAGQCDVTRGLARRFVRQAADDRLRTAQQLDSRSLAGD